MTQPFRTAAGGMIDRKTPLRFFFDGMAYTGHAGDTLASALLANGVHLTGRSYKYHRPRGILSAGAEEPNALVTVHRGPGRVTPNLRATEVPLIDGLEAESQNRWPSLGLDFGAINGLGSTLFSAGFYYKTFMGPKAAGSRLWHRLFEPVVRHAAGLGPAPTEPDPDSYAQLHLHCDVLVIGAGPAGIAAALAAGAGGADVVLCDDQDAMGGCLLAETTAVIDGQPAAQWLETALARLRAMGNVRLLPRTQAFGYYAQNFVALAERLADHAADPGQGPRERLWQVRAKEVVIAAGAIERPLVFPDNDRPGILLAGAARAYLNRFGVRVGTRAVVVTAHDSAYRVAIDLAAAGVAIAAIIDLRTAPGGPLVQAAREAGLPVLSAMTVTGTRGRRHVTAARIAPVDATDAGRWITCDTVLMSGGWTPSLHLHSQSRGTVVWNGERQMFLPGAAAQAARSAGGCNGTFGLAAVLAEGIAAGQAAAGIDGKVVAPEVAGDLPQTGGFIGALPGEDAIGGMAFVDFQNDVKASDIRLAVREGMRSIEHVKRYTTTGMATDQGKTSNLNALAVAAQALGKPLDAVGLTTFRQPYTPVSFGTFAGASRGDLFDPVRLTPLHERLVAAGAVFEDVGLWKRAWHYPLAGETLHQSVARECRTTRAAAGLFDASTLGKIEVVGPDAATFLDRIYTIRVSTLKPGRCRYGLMLNEAGFVIDDGIVARLAQDRFHITTTTGGAARVLHHMEDYLQTEWPDLACWLTSTTEQWAVIAVQGPKARDILAPFCAGFDISAGSMPHLSIGEGRVCGVPARVMRVSFTGELGFEVNVPSAHAPAVWDALIREGARHGAVPYGTEAMHVMRAEKGYIIVGQETDGTVTPDDLGLGWAVANGKHDFVGKRSLVRPDMIATGRKQLVGLVPLDPSQVPEEGAQVTDVPNPALGSAALGHVTSAYASPALGHPVALGLVADGRKRHGETLYLPMPHGPVAVRVTAPVFLDPRGERLNG